VVEASQWPKDAPMWVGADYLDRRRDEYDIHPQLYNLDAVAYESVILGLFTIWTGQQGVERPKPNELYVAWSRDGFHWHRPNRQPFVPVSDTPQAWNFGNVQSAGGCCLVVGDELRFYVSGRSGVAGSGTNTSGICSTGLATLRRDGFASLDGGEKGGTVTTRPLVFKGSHLFVNVKAPAGELRVEILDADRNPIAPFSLENSTPIQTDSTLQPVQWNSGQDLSTLAGKPVRFRFHLKNGSLYSFWVSPDKSGASHGYVAAGGPGFTGPTDTVGDKAGM
jgi:hypothetical protein